MKSIWISKYALSEGIKAVDWDGQVSDYGRVTAYGFWSSFKFGKEAHETEKAAREAAEAMRLKKIASLKKQIAKLEKMSFINPNQ